MNANEVFLLAAQFGSQLQLEDVLVGFGVTGELEPEMLEIAQPGFFELTADQQFNDDILGLQLMQFCCHPELHCFVEADAFAGGIQAAY